MRRETCWRPTIPGIAVEREEAKDRDDRLVHGRWYALDLALDQPKLAAAVINYGHLATDDGSLSKINAPILGLFGGQDRGIPPDSVNAFEQQLKKLGRRWK